MKRTSATCSQTCWSILISHPLSPSKTSSFAHMQCSRDLCSKTPRSRRLWAWYPTLLIHSIGFVLSFHLYHCNILNTTFPSPSFSSSSSSSSSSSTVAAAAALCVVYRLNRDAVVYIWGVFEDTHKRTLTNVQTCSLFRNEIYIWSDWFKLPILFRDELWEIVSRDQVRTYKPKIVLKDQRCYHAAWNCIVDCEGWVTDSFLFLDFQMQNTVDKLARYIHHQTSEMPIERKE